MIATVSMLTGISIDTLSAWTAGGAGMVILLATTVFRKTFFGE